MNPTEKTRNQAIAVFRWFCDTARLHEKMLLYQRIQSHLKGSANEIWIISTIHYEILNPDPDDEFNRLVHRVLEQLEKQEEETQ